MGRRWSVECDPSVFSPHYALAFGGDVLAVTGNRARVYSGTDGQLLRSAELGFALDWACECSGGAIVLTTSYGAVTTVTLRFLSSSLQLSGSLTYSTGSQVPGVRGDLLDAPPRMEPLGDGRVRLMSGFVDGSAYFLRSVVVDSTLALSEPQVHSRETYVDEDWARDPGPLLGEHVAPARSRYAIGIDLVLAGLGADPLYIDSSTSMATLRSLPALNALTSAQETTSQVRYYNARAARTGAPLLLSTVIDGTPTLTLVGMTRAGARPAGSVSTPVRSLWYGVDALADGTSLVVLRGGDPTEGSLERIYLELWETTTPVLRLNQREDGLGIVSSARLSPRTGAYRSVQRGQRLGSGQTYA